MYLDGLTKFPHRIIALVILMNSLPFAALAETLYVSDTLRVGIRTEPNNNVPSIAVIKSGAEVEVIERIRSYIKVRTKSGVEGWVKSAYFSNKTPAATRLKLAKSQIVKLEKKIETLKNQKMDNPDLSEKVTNLTSQNQKLTIEVEKQKELFSSLPKTGSNLSLDNINENVIYIILGIFILLIGVGFLLGVSWHKNQIAKRLGGMSI